MSKLTLVFCILLMACTTSGKMAPLAVPDRNAIPDSSRYEEDGKLIAGPPLPGLHFAPSEGTCAPAARPLAFTACCGENACNGHCVYAEDSGASVCSCFGEVGGCKEGMICSKIAHRCVKNNEVKPR
jgi:hypothetical protein